jgi:hypothetical protein
MYCIKLQVAFMKIPPTPKNWGSKGYDPTETRLLIFTTLLASLFIHISDEWLFQAVFDNETGEKCTY